MRTLLLAFILYIRVQIDTTHYLPLSIFITLLIAYAQGKRTALYHACDMGNAKVVEALLAHSDIELNSQCKKVSYIKPMPMDCTKPMYWVLLCKLRLSIVYCEFHCMHGW